MSRLLVYRYGGIGDTLTLTPFLASLRSLYDDITLVGNAERLEIIDPLLHDRVLSYDLVARSISDLAAGADLSVAFSANEMPGFTARFAPFPANKANVYDYMQSMGTQLGGRIGLGSLCQFATSQIGKVTPFNNVAPALARSGMIIHPGSGSPAKNAPLEFFIERAHKDAVFILGPAEDSSFESRVEQEGFSWLRPRTLRDLKDVILRHGIFLGNDSGPAHIAALNGMETHIRFVSSDPNVWLPPGAGVVP